eukprot:scaffold58965_cov63-Phaeocystis_antarctica.AAC.1
MGDAASNIGRAGHNQRHQTVLRQLVLIMQGVWGTRCGRDGAAGPPRLLERLPARRHWSGTR